MQAARLKYGMGMQWQLELVIQSYVTMTSLPSKVELTSSLAVFSTLLFANP